jgi:diguanylate cyclase
MRLISRTTVHPAVVHQGLAERLTTLSLGTAAMALLVAGLLLNGAMYYFQRQALVQEATAQARVVADNAAAALMFADPSAAQETLRSLERSPRVARATLYDKKRAVFADFIRQEAAHTLVPSGEALEQEGWHAVGGDLIVLEPVSGSRGDVGWLRLQVPTKPLIRATVLFAGVTLLAALAAMSIAWALGRGMRADVARIEQRLDDLAYRDPVTGLYNRHAAAAHLEQYANQAQAAPGGGFSVLSFDLDDFKQINDTLGHPIGDEVLRTVSKRLVSSLEPGARAYRFGGDEFVVICPCPQGLAEPQRYGELVRHALGGTLQIEGYEIPLAGSVGVARFPQDGEHAAAVLLASDIAMYRAKARGKNNMVVFDASLRARSHDRLRLKSDLRQALRDEQFLLLYQPIVEVATGRWVGAEALVRWRHPERGMLGPLEFIPAAESSGLVVPLGGWVLCEAARQLAQWHDAGLPPLRVAVNVSARQLRQGQLLAQYREALAVVAGSNILDLGLEIELTEHTLVEDVEENLVLLKEMRRAGVRIAIDDFGTGLSSLAYLKRLPIDKLKIDRSFVSGLPDDAGDKAIVSAALSMARALGLTVVAEGVETPAQFEALKTLGCALAQGYLFGKPMPAAMFAKAFCENVELARQAQPAEHASLPA